MTDSIENPRELALNLLMEVTENKEFSHNILDKALNKYAYLEKKDRAFITRVVNGTLEYLLQIDYIISLYNKAKRKSLKPVIKNILRISIYQIIYMDRVPDSAICNEAVKLVKKYGLAGLGGFVNAILRNISKDKGSFVFKSLDIKYSTPKWIIDTIKNTTTESIEDILSGFFGDNSIGIRINTLKNSKEELIKELSDLSIEVQISEFMPEVIYIKNFDKIGELPCIKEKRAFVQDVSSALAIKLLDIKKDSIIYDLCASPGGKSIYALNCLADTGFLISCDISEKKTEMLRSNFMGVEHENYDIKINDARMFNIDFENKADYIIADLPCSGLGIIGKKPDIKYNMTSDIARDLESIQKKMLENAVKYLKSGGKLLFSTCTINKNENFSGRDYIINQGLKPVDFSGILKESIQKAANLAKDSKKEYRNGLKKNYDELLEESKNGYLQLLPGVYKSDGFFISIYEKE